MAKLCYCAVFGLKSIGLQSVVSNAEGLQRADQGRQRTVFAYPDSLA